MGEAYLGVHLSPDRCEQGDNLTVRGKACCARHNKLQVVQE